MWLRSPTDWNWEKDRKGCSARMDSSTSALWACSFSLNADKDSMFFGSWRAQTESAGTVDALAPSAALTRGPALRKRKSCGRNRKESNSTISFFNCDCHWWCMMCINTHTHIRTHSNSDCSSVSILAWNLISHMGAGCMFVNGVMGVSFTLLVRRTARRLFY